MSDTTPGRPAMTLRQICEALGQTRPAPSESTRPVPAPPPARPAAPSVTVDSLVPHGEPIDIGWANHSLDARLQLTVRPGMDPAEREQLLAVIRDALAPAVPVRRTGREVSS